jgi:hypothetical protein
MKTPEDEAFEDIERRQGGGFQAKRAAAADKAQDESDMLTIAYLDGYERGKRAVLAQPAQEPDYWLGYGLQAHTEKPFENATALYITPPKREWVGLTDEEMLHIGVATGLERAAVEMISNKLKDKNA